MHLLCLGHLPVLPIWREATKIHPQSALPEMGILDVPYALATAQFSGLVELRASQSQAIEQRHGRNIPRNLVQGRTTHSPLPTGRQMSERNWRLSVLRTSLSEGRNNPAHRWSASVATNSAARLATNPLRINSSEHHYRGQRARSDSFRNRRCIIWGRFQWWPARGYQNT